MQERVQAAMGGGGLESMAGTWQPAVGSDPTQGRGTDAWQRALKMGLEVNARNRSN